MSEQALVRRWNIEGSYPKLFQSTVWQLRIDFSPDKPTPGLKVKNEGFVQVKNPKLSRIRLIIDSGFSSLVMAII